MKTSILLMSLLIFTGCASSRGFVKNQKRINEIRTVAVLPFQCSNIDIGNSVCETLSANLLETRLDFIERIQLQKLIDEQNLTLGGVVDNPGLIIGKIKGIDALIVGTVSIDVGFAGLAYGGNVAYVSNANARIVDANTGQVLAVATFTASNASTWTGKHTAEDVGEDLAEELEDYIDP